MTRQSRAAQTRPGRLVDACRAGRRPLGSAITTAPPASAAGESAAAAPLASPALVSVVGTDLGPILIDGGGQTIYGFTQDSDGESTCFGGCADAWPPLIVEASFDLSTLPNAELFSLVDRPDGLSQLKAGQWPLYYFAGDTAAGEINGQGSGGSWFVVAGDATLVK